MAKLTKQQASTRAKKAWKTRNSGSKVASTAGATAGALAGVKAGGGLPRIAAGVMIGSYGARAIHKAATNKRNAKTGIRSQKTQAVKPQNRVGKKR